MPNQPRSAPAAGETLQTVADQLNAPEAAGARVAAHGVSNKSAVVTKLWAMILQSSAKHQDDLLKPLPPARLLHLMEGAETDPSTAYAAAGCLAALISHPLWLAHLTATAAAANRLVCACVGLLTGPHDRSRLPAVQLLQALSACPLQVPRLAAALPPILSLLSEAGGPGWAGGRQLASGACTVLAALLAPSECEAAAAQQQARRSACLSSGAVQSLLVLLKGGNGGAVMMPAAACLRFLALAPGAADVMAGDPAVSSHLLRLLSCASLHPGVCAYVSGILWELAASTAAAEQLLAAGAVTALLQVVRDTAADVVGSGSGKNKKKGRKKPDGKGRNAAEKHGKSSSSSSSSSSKGKDVKAAAGAAAGEGADVPAFVLLQDPQAAAGVALCNATGALFHLSFLDEAKAQVGASVRLELLVKLSGQTQGQTYDNLTGLLWNVGLLGVNQPLLAAAGAPDHLVHPTPARWTTSPAATCRPASAATLGAMAGAKPPPPAAAVLLADSVRQTTLRFVG